MSGVPSNSPDPCLDHGRGDGQGHRGEDARFFGLLQMRTTDTSLPYPSRSTVRPQEALHLTPRRYGIGADRGRMQLKQARTPPGLTPEDADPHSAAEAVGAVDRPRIGDRAHPTGRRTTRQNDGLRHPGRSAERHLRVRSRLASMLGVGRLGPRREPAFGGRPLPIHRIRWGTGSPMSGHRNCITVS